MGRAITGQLDGTLHLGGPPKKDSDCMGMGGIARTGSPAHTGPQTFPGFQKGPAAERSPKPAVQCHIYTSISGKHPEVKLFASWWNLLSKCTNGTALRLIFKKSQERNPLSNLLWDANTWLYRLIGLEEKVQCPDPVWEVLAGRWNMVLLQGIEFFPFSSLPPNFSYLNSLLILWTVWYMLIILPCRHIPLSLRAVYVSRCL